MRSTGVRLVTRPTRRTVPTSRSTVSPWSRCRRTPPSCWPAARRPGWAGRPSRSCEVGGRTDARPPCWPPSPTPSARIVVGPPAAGPGRRPSGPRAAARRRPGRRAAGRPGRRRRRDVVARPRRRPAVPHRGLIAELRARLTGDGVLVVDDGGRDQYLLGVWRTAALRVGDRPTRGGPTPLRRVLAPLAVSRYRPVVEPGTPAAVDRLRHPRRPRPGPGGGRCARRSRRRRRSAAVAHPALPEPRRTDQRGVSLGVPRGGRTRCTSAVASPRSLVARARSLLSAALHRTGRGTEASAGERLVVVLGPADDDTQQSPPTTRSRRPRRTRSRPTTPNFPADTADDGGRPQAGASPDPAGQMQRLGYPDRDPAGLRPGW